MEANNFIHFSLSNAAIGRKNLVSKLRNNIKLGNQVLLSL